MKDAVLALADAIAQNSPDRIDAARNFSLGLRFAAKRQAECRARAKVAARLQTWMQAIGSMLAEHFDVADEPLPLEMDLMLRLLAAEEQDRSARVRPKKKARKKVGGASK